MTFGILFSNSAPSLRRSAANFCAIFSSGPWVGVSMSNVTVVPSAIRPWMEVTLSTIIPYLIDLDPALLFAVIPPMVARLEVATSTGKKRPCGLRNWFR